MNRRDIAFILCITCGAGFAEPAFANALNPNISILGQPFLSWTDDLENASRKRAVFDQGELEMIADAYLNPYAKGDIFAALTDEGFELEEGYFTLLRGLPAQLQLKGGKYRVDYGKINVMHAHQLPFAERPRVVAAYLPGEESFNEVGVSVSARLPAPGTFSLTAAADWLQGDSFRLEREPSPASDDPLADDPEDGDRALEARPAFSGTLSGFGILGDRSGIEVALSATGGTNNVAAQTRTYVYDAAAKLKLWTAPRAYLLVQGELLTSDREIAAWDSTAAAYTKETARPVGGYLYADYNFNPRYNAGVYFESYQQPTVEKPVDRAVGAFVGLALMEETTSFRLDWNRLTPGVPDGADELPSVNTVTLRVIFSLGPHKAHTF